MIYSLKQNDDEIEGIVALINEAYRGTGGRNRWTTEGHLLAGDRISVEILKDLINNSQCDFITCYEQNKLVGSISITYKDELAEFGTFAIKQEHHGMGMGKQLLAYAEHFARKRCGRFQVSVLTANQSLIEFYLKRGYQVRGQKVLHINDDGGRQASEIDFTVLDKEA